MEMKLIFLMLQLTQKCPEFNLSLTFKRNSLSNTVKLGYNVVIEHSVKTNRFLRQIGYISTQINPVITNPGYIEQNWSAPSCSL